MLATISDVCRDSGFQSSQRRFGITSRLVESVLKLQEVSFGDGFQLRLAALCEQRSSLLAEQSALGSDAWTRLASRGGASG
jgi:hypothetical protein